MALQVAYKKNIDKLGQIQMHIPAKSSTYLLFLVLFPIVGHIMFAGMHINLALSKNGVITRKKKP